MVLLNSPLCKFGEKYKDFRLLNIDEKEYSLRNLTGHNGTLIMFICNHCPYVKAIITKLVETTGELNNFGINSAAIMPNDYISYPEDNFKNMQIFAEKNNFNFPYLIDKKQDVAKSYGAVCTPDFFGYNKRGELNYRGRISKIKNLRFVSEKNELLDAMKEIAINQKGPSEQFPSSGCSIKWKKI